MLKNLSAKLQVVIDFLSSHETNEYDFKLDLYYEYNRKISYRFRDRIRRASYGLLVDWKQKTQDKAIHFLKSRKSEKIPEASEERF
jgi:hypothetical protein